MTLENKPLPDPTLTDVLTAAQQDFALSLNCVKIGEIQSFDPVKKTATIQILFTRVLADDTVQSYPLLVDCPVFTLQGDGGGIQFPIVAGDQCLVLFADRNIDAWFTTGNEQPPLTPRTHDLSDGIALVGLNSLASTFDNYQDSKARFFYAGYEISLSSDGISIGSSGGQIVFSSTGVSIRASNDDTKAEVNLSNQIVQIKNATTTLLTLIDSLFTAIEGIQVTGPLSLTPGSIAALEAVKTQFAGLLS